MQIEQYDKPWGFIEYTNGSKTESGHYSTLADVIRYYVSNSVRGYAYITLHDIAVFDISINDYGHYDKHEEWLCMNYMQTQDPFHMEEMPCEGLDIDSFVCKIQARLKDHLVSLDDERRHTKHIIEELAYL